MLVFYTASHQLMYRLPISHSLSHHPLSFRCSTVRDYFTKNHKYISQQLMTHYRVSMPLGLVAENSVAAKQAALELSE